VHQNMDNLKDALAKVDDKLSELKTAQVLAAGIQNCAYNSFDYNVKDSPEKSENLVRTILFVFQKGPTWSTFLPNATFGRFFCSYDVCKRQQEFRDKLVEQIYALTGVKPRIVEPEKEGDHYAIYQS
jgi:hypothetical protein